MIGTLLAGVRHLREASRFVKAPATARALAVFAEGRGDWPHIGPVVEELLARGRPVAYVTGSPEDPLLADPPEGLAPHLLGTGVVFTAFAAALDSRVLFTTTPDLGASYFPRSSAAPVRYAYVFHSLVSTHMIYLPAAFDHFDALLCAGPHHVRELRAREAALGLEPRQLVEVGYPRLDALAAAARVAPPPPTDPPRVLLAPSWGPDGILERGALPLVRGLLEAGLHVTVRPHPMTRRLAGPALDALRAALAGEALLAWEEDVRDQASLLAASVMISDWSGAAYEFAFGLERPVLFLDVPRKVRNPGYEELGIEPMEVALRDQVGAVLPPDDAAAAARQVARLLGPDDARAAALAEARAAHVFHPGEAATRGADALEALLEAGR